MNSVKGTMALEGFMLTQEDVEMIQQRQEGSITHQQFIQKTKEDVENNGK